MKIEDAILELEQYRNWIDNKVSQGDKVEIRKTTVKEIDKDLKIAIQKLQTKPKENYLKSKE